MAVRRARDDTDLPRWLTEPTVADWVSAEEVLGLVERERERAAQGYGSPPPGPVLSHEAAGRAFARVLAYGRFIEALDIEFGTDAWPTEWASATWRWEAAPGSPPADLVAVVSVRRGHA